MPTWLASRSTEATAPPQPVITGDLGQLLATGGRAAVTGLLATPAGAAVPATRPRAVRRRREPAQRAGDGRVGRVRDVWGPHPARWPGYAGAWHAEQPAVTPAGRQTSGPSHRAVGDQDGRPGQLDPLAGQRAHAQPAPGDVDPPDVAPVLRLPAQKRVARAAAQAPVPHDRVSPTPRSCTRIAMCPAPIGRTNSTLVPCGGTRVARSGPGAGRARRGRPPRAAPPRCAGCRGRGSAPSTGSRAVEVDQRVEALAPGASPGSVTRHGAEVDRDDPSPSNRTSFTPARVAMANSSAVSQPLAAQVGREDPRAVAAHLGDRCRRRCGSP